LTRDQEEAYAAYYFRGFLLLHEMSEWIGRSKFRDMIGEFAQFCINHRSITTDTFLEFAEQSLGKKVRELVDRWLDYDGIGIPTS